MKWSQSKKTLRIQILFINVMIQTERDSRNTLHIFLLGYPGIRGVWCISNITKSVTHDVYSTEKFSLTNHLFKTHGPSQPISSASQMKSLPNTSLSICTLRPSCFQSPHPSTWQENSSYTEGTWNLFPGLLANNLLISEIPVYPQAVMREYYEYRSSYICCLL